MTVIEQLQAASFKGFSFLVNTERSESGKKLAVHEYPNSNRRYAEELGHLPPTLTINAIVHGDINARLRFEQILREPGLGTLVHPVYGTLEVMAGIFTVNSTQTRIGEFLFVITFYTTEENVTPSVNLVSGTQITTGVDTVQTALGNALETTYKSPTFVDSLNTAADKVGTFFTLIEQGSQKITNPITRNLSAFNNVLNTARAGVFTIVQSAVNLRSAFESTFTALVNIADTPADLKDVWDDLFDFGSDDTTISNTTVKRQEIIDNRNAINDYIQIQALARAHETAAFIDYQTDTELLTSQSNLETEFARILLTRITAQSIQESKLLALDADVRKYINSLRNDTKKVLELALQNVWRVVNIGPLKSTMFLTAYRYYGNVDDLDILIDLNPDANVAGFNQTLKAISR